MKNIILDIELRTLDSRIGLAEFVIVANGVELNRAARLADAIGIRDRYVTDHNNGESESVAVIGHTV